MKKDVIIATLLVLAWFFSCAPTKPPIQLKDVEKLRVDYNRGKIEKIEDLIAIFQNPELPLEIRLTALQALAETNHPDAWKAMQNYVSNTMGLNYDLLAATVNALMSKPSPDNISASVNGLISAQKKYSNFRTIILQKLEKQDIAMKIEQLLNLYQAERENYVTFEESLTKLLGSIPDDRTIPILISIAKDPNAKVTVRSLAFEILGKKRHPLITETFLEMLKDPTLQFEVRDFALKAIEDVKEERVILALLETLNRHREEHYNIVEILTKAFGEYSDPAVIPALITIAQDNNYPLNIRRNALQALGKFKSQEVFDKIISMLENPDNYVFYDEFYRMATEIGGTEPLQKLRRAALVAQKKIGVTP